jgi:hypothetical protein
VKRRSNLFLPPRPSQAMAEHCDLFRAADIACIIGDDSDHGSGNRQYSGLWTLVSRHLIHTAVAPPYACLLAGTHRGTRPDFDRLDDRTAILHRPAGEGQILESTSTFRLLDPAYVDYSYAVTLREPYAGSSLGDWMELGWCNYMNAVTDPAIYFVSGGRWVREYSTQHGYKSMFYPSGLPWEQREHRPVEEYRRRGLEVPFHWTASETAFDLPLYYGRVHRMVYLVMFDRYLDWRFFTSPTGGGGNALGPGYHNPAWDWSWMIKGPEIGKKYECNLRLVYKPFAGNDDVLDEYRNWEHADSDRLREAGVG